MTKHTQSMRGCTFGDYFSPKIQNSCRHAFDARARNLTATKTRHPSKANLRQFRWSLRPMNAEERFAFGSPPEEHTRRRACQHNHKSPARESHCHNADQSSAACAAFIIIIVAKVRRAIALPKLRNSWHFWASNARNVTSLTWLTQTRGDRGDTLHRNKFFAKRGSCHKPSVADPFDGSRDTWPHITLRRTRDCEKRSTIDDLLAPKRPVFF